MDQDYNEDQFIEYGDDYYDPDYDDDYVPEPQIKQKKTKKEKILAKKKKKKKHDTSIKNEPESDMAPFYKCPYCSEVFTDFTYVEKHVANEHKDQLPSDVKCTECQESLPNDPKYIGNHMVTKHMMSKHKSAHTFIVDDTKEKRVFVK